MTPTKYKIFAKMLLVSGCSLTLASCSTSNGFDDESVNQRSSYRDDDMGNLLPSPARAAEEARQYQVVEDEKRIQGRKSGDDPLAQADADGKLDDLTAAYAQILVPQAMQEDAYFSPVKKGKNAQEVIAGTGTIKTGGTTRRKPVFLGKIGMQAMIDQAAVNMNAPAAVTGGMMSFSAKSSRGAGQIANRESMGSYIVRPGDTLSTISVHIYGTTGRWMELAHMNRLGNGSVIFPNELILYIPDKTAAKTE